MPTHALPTRRGPRALTDQTPVVLLIAVLAVVGAGVWANVATAGPDRPPVIVSAVVATAVVLLTVALALGRGRAVRRLRSQVTDLENRLAGAQLQVQTQNTRAAQLADQVLPAVVKRLRDGASPEAALAEIAEIGEIGEIGAADPEIGDGNREARETHRRILRALATEIGRGERMRAAAMSACANAAGRVQALATSMLADLREMEERHDEEVFGDLLRLDHATAQAGRLADSIAVLTGARTGRRWTKPIVMESILRGAVGRISAYQRVRLHSTSTVAVAGYAAEGVMHALAELMDNATSFSPPSEEVHVYVEEVQAGIVVTIEDGGLVMGPAALRRAEAAVSAEPLDLTTLSGTRLGLAVVGVLARKHGLTVSFRPSSRGGTGVVVMIPRRLVTQPRPNPAATGLPVGGIVGATAGAPGTARRADAGAASRGAIGMLERPVSAEPGFDGTGFDGTGFNGTELAGTELAGTDFAGGAAAGRPAAPGTPILDSPTGPVARADVPGEPAAPPAPREALPKRRRGETMANAVGRLPVPPAPARTSPPADAGARFGAFRRATRGGRTDADASSTSDVTDRPDAGRPPLPPLPPLSPSRTEPAAPPPPPSPAEPPALPLLPPSLTGPTALTGPTMLPEPPEPHPDAGGTASSPDTGTWFQTRGGTDADGSIPSGHPTRRNGNS